MWEDKANKDGGRWVITVDRKTPEATLDNYWLELVMCMIGECFTEHNDNVNGATVNVRGKWNKISLWTRDTCNEHGELIKIGLKLKNVLGLPPSQISGMCKLVFAMSEELCKFCTGAIVFLAVTTATFGSTPADGKIPKCHLSYLSEKLAYFFILKVPSACNNFQMSNCKLIQINRVAAVITNSQRISATRTSRGTRQRMPGSRKTKFVLILNNLKNIILYTRYCIPTFSIPGIGCIAIVKVYILVSPNSEIIQGT
ncbi:unnamed protein product [Nesidiocoris tenuis]|uniref:Uncharacterized protein n=1 Tax=Nesidiocoris tenuis TaxID=355587 RepID=A0A6H5H7E3_9HEMI|nr:unnamed protein product [Nesidiocoris tenuis]